MCHRPPFTPETCYSSANRVRRVFGPQAGDRHTGRIANRATHRR